MTSAGEPSRIAAVIPVASFEAAKSRLGGALDAEERQDLVERLLGQTVAAAMTVARLADVLVISPDPEVLGRAADLGARTLRQRSVGLNAGLVEARSDAVAGGADALIVLPIDLAFISPATLEAALEPILRPGRAPAVVLVTDRNGSGTNLLALRPPDVIEFAFGPGSREAHREAAEGAGAIYTEVEGLLSFDIDTPADLVVVESMAPEGIGAG
jgi:2-phospho-L-lactate guanylyltransferase